LVLFDHLSLNEQQVLGALRDDPDGYGILRPRSDPRLSIKSVSKETALLLFTLERPSILPQFATNSLGARCDAVIAQMVLDGILEIESNGEMVSGSAARNLVLDEREPPERLGAVAALSLRALQYAEALDIEDAIALAGRLYRYNAVPACARWRRVLSDEATVEAHLGITTDVVARTINVAWFRTPSLAKTNGWIAWQSRRSPPPQRALAYKLYISPVCADLAAAFASTAETLSRSASFFWKIGNGLFGLLRPDKIVAYFAEFDELQDAASSLYESLQGCRAQGVPFTAEFAGAGLLSWGVDPPAEIHSVPWLERESWRGRICSRLGASLAAAKSSADGSSPARFALARLALDGINTDTWTPV
jgi:hypothetical protein